MNWSVAVITLIGLALSVNASAGQTPSDARDVLRQASQAMRHADWVSYDASYLGAGAFSGYPPVQAAVVIQRLAADSQVPAKISTKGKFFRPGERNPVVFDVAFDGSAVRWISRRREAVVERAFLPDGPQADDWGQITGLLGRGGYFSILWQFLDEEPLNRAVQAPLVEYEGSISVDNVLCHIIYIEREPRRGWRWFIGMDDLLPRRLEEFGETDGRSYVSLLTLTNLDTSPPERDGVFAVRVPQGYVMQTYQPRSHSTPLLASGHVAPEWTLLDGQGRTHSLTQLRGKIVVLDFWATWCGPCKMVMPQLQQLHERFADRGLVVIGVNCFETLGSADPDAYVQRMGYTYLHLRDGDDIAKAYHTTVLPTLYVIGPDGSILHSQVGVGEGLGSLTEIIQKHLGKS